MQWYYAKGGQRLGPVEEAELVRLAQSGGLLPSDLVWHAGMGSQWQPAGSMRELFPETPLASPAPAAPPPPAVPVPGAVGVPAAPPAPAPVPTYVPVMGNAELIGHAWRVLGGQWGIAIGGSLLFMVLGSALVFTLCGSLICGGAMTVGLVFFSLNLARRSRPDIGNLFAGFNRFGDSLVAYLLMMVFVCLWTLLFFIPGIIAAYRYSLTFYLLADNPHLTGYDAIKRSGELMRGHKWRLFCLDLWLMLLSFGCMFTCGIGYLWLLPYSLVLRASFYDDILRRQAKPVPAQP